MRQYMGGFYWTVPWVFNLGLPCISSSLLAKGFNTILSFSPRTKVLDSSSWFVKMPSHQMKENIFNRPMYLSCICFIYFGVQFYMMRIFHMIYKLTQVWTFFCLFYFCLLWWIRYTTWYYCTCPWFIYRAHYDIIRQK